MVFTGNKEYMQPSSAIPALMMDDQEAPMLLPRRTGFPTRILVDNGKKLKCLDVADIVYLKAERDYTVIHTMDSSYLSSYGIGAIENKLDPQQFMRIHRSFIVNLHCIKELYRDITRMFLVLDNGMEVNVGRSYADGIRKMIF
jgi:two-component system LytT family response regulator